MDIFLKIFEYDFVCAVLHMLHMYETGAVPRNLLDILPRGTRRDFDLVLQDKIQQPPKSLRVSLEGHRKEEDLSRTFISGGYF